MSEENLWLTESKWRTLTLRNTQFIADIRACRVKEVEEKRINKEMANIRKQFKGLFNSLALAPTLTFTILGRPATVLVPAQEVRC